MKFTAQCAESGSYTKMLVEEERDFLCVNMSYDDGNESEVTILLTPADELRLMKFLACRAAEALTGLKVEFQEKGGDEEMD